MSATTELNMYRATPRTIRGMILDCMYAGLVPFLQSSPGMGKSAIHRSIARELMLKMIDVRMSTTEPTDFTGLPNFVNGKARYSAFEDMFPLESSTVPDGFQGWLLFLDEINAGQKMSVAASYKLILDRMVGNEPLHQNVLISTAGNLSTDRAIVSAMGTAMQSRLIHMEMIVSAVEHLEDVMLTEGYDSRIIAYLAQYPDELMDFRPDHKEKTFCCPRTWEFMNRLVKDKEINDSKTILYAGTITSGVAVKFVEFVKVFDKMISVSEILSDPSGCVLPHDNNTRWALISTMMEKANDKNFGGLATYANRFGLDFRLLFYRSVRIRNASLRKHPAYIQGMLELNRYLND